jgi:hypothetical protein
MENLLQYCLCNHSDTGIAHSLKKVGHGRHKIHIASRKIATEKGGLFEDGNFKAGLC